MSESKTAPRLLTRQEAAGYLRCSVDALARFIRDRQDPLKFLSAGRRHLFDPAELVGWASRRGRRVQAKLVGRR